MMSPIFIQLSSKKGFRGSIRPFFDKVSRNWEQAWQQSVTPWDLKGTVCPPLVEVVSRGRIQSQGKRALIPGCGSGYECIYLRKSGFQEVTGLDLSDTAINSAKENLQRQAGVDKVHFQVVNFFEYKGPYQFEFIFDYLFFSAIEPSCRNKWAESITSNLSPDGVLATLVFPMKIENDDSLIGPPYPVTIEDYIAVLHPLGIHIDSIEKVGTSWEFPNPHKFNHDILSA
jgi:SAM-dependent methyltransferase